MTYYVSIFTLESGLLEAFPMNMESSEQKGCDILDFLGTVAPFLREKSHFVEKTLMGKGRANG